MAMTLLTFVCRNLWQRRTRSVLTVTGLAVAVTTIVVLVGMSWRFEATFFELYGARGSDLVVQRRGGTQRLNSGVEERLKPRIEALPNARQAIGSLMDVVALEQHQLYAVIVNGWPKDSPVLDRLNILSGRRWQAGERQSVMLGKVLARNTGKQVGDKLEIYAEEFEIVGIFESFSVIENGAAFFPLPELQRLTGRPGLLTGYVVKAHDARPEALAELRRQIEALDPNLVCTPTAEFVGGISQIQLSRSIAWIVSTIAVAIGAIGMLNTMVMAVTERTREIGTLRALGWRQARVAWAIVLEAIVLSVVGALIGCLLAILVLRLLSHLPNTSGLVDGRFSPWVIVLGLTLSLTISTLGAAYPAWWAARLTPMDALRRKA
jgi:putative ABC transport system permease protein